MVNPDRYLMTYALDCNDRLVHVDAVLNGLQCNCHCPSCGEKLIARHGKKNKHSFAHYNKNDFKCAYGYQTSLHLLAKEIISEGCKILLPPVYYDEEASAYSCIDKSFYEKIHTPVFKQYPLIADSVEVEKRYDDYIPDIIIHKQDKVHNKDRILIVEIYVTHPVDDEKRKKIKDSNISAIEINLSKTERNLDKNTLREILESGDNCHWIYNAEGSKKTMEFIKKAEQIKTQMAAKEQQKKKEQERRKPELINKYGGNLRYYKVIETDQGPIIFNPPCKNADPILHYGANRRVKEIEGCSLCPFYIKLDDSFLWCQRQRFSNPNTKSTITTFKDIKRWISLFYKSNSFKVSWSPAHNNDIALSLIKHGTEIAHFYGHTEFDEMIESFCKSLIENEFNQYIAKRKISF